MRNTGLSVIFVLMTAFAMFFEPPLLMRIYREWSTSAEDMKRVDTGVSAPNLSLHVVDGQIEYPQ